MHKNLAIVPAAFALTTLCIYCSFAQGNADVRSFEKLQRQLWSTRSQAKAQNLMDITAELDSICGRLLQGQNDFSAKKAAIDSFYRYDGRIPLLLIAEIDRETSVVLYNISYAGEAYIPIVNVFSTTKGGVTKIATLSLEKAKFPSGAYMYVPFQEVYVLDDALDNKKYIVLAGANRIASYLVLIEMNWNKGELALLESKYFNMWNAHVKDRIRLDSDRIIVRYPMESKIITEGWGESMLLVQDHIGVRNGVLKTEAREVLNPWYETVLDAIRLQQDGDREGFNKLCKVEGAWKLLSEKAYLLSYSQKKIDNAKALVILGAMASPEASPKKLVFYLSKEEEKWTIVEVHQDQE